MRQGSPSPEHYNTALLFKSACNSNVPQDVADILKSEVQVSTRQQSELF